VQSNYKSKSNLVHWENKQSDAATSIRYDEEGTDITYMSFLVDGRVVKYALMGDARIHANEWGEYANTHFTSQKYGLWIDYVTQTQWTLKILEGSLAVFEAVAINK
jgi:hypothetical protein